ncbi:hypothetical protein [Tautonia rosea]|uniref:hypothetical protein n=1 Tax=Tautonia rosea TaxID=2728037 RepID=UPI001475E95B|nr:hypothetical protein [Tautonia rosea]
MNGPCFGSLLAGAVLWLWPVVAIGQPIFGHAESIEATVANADLVFVGTLLDFDLLEGPEGFEARFLVEETLKVPIGECYEKLSVVLREPQAVLGAWKGEERRLLVAVRDESRVPASIIDLEDERLSLLTADFTLLRDRDDVLQAARETVSRMPSNVKRIHTFRREVPREVIARTRWEEYDGVTVSVPVDDRLEQWAREAICSEELPRRLEAVRALRYFRSDETIALLKPLLDDPGWAILHHAQENEGREVRRYLVRAEAYRALKAWGVDVRRPKIEETIEVHSINPVR